jgi:hypothetical protein
MSDSGGSAIVFFESMFANNYKRIQTLNLLELRIFES